MCEASRQKEDTEAHRTNATENDNDGTLGADCEGKTVRKKRSEAANA